VQPLAIISQFVAERLIGRVEEVALEILSAENRNFHAGTITGLQHHSWMPRKSITRAPH
jgi:hypothetical protein